MRIRGTRMALAALSALAATAVFNVPAQATVYEQGISVLSHGHIHPDGTVTLSGTYHCTNPSPVGAKLQIAASVQQDGSRLAFGAGEAHCDGREHTWEATGSLRYTPGIHPGAATAAAQLNEIHFSGLMPRAVDTVAEDRREIRLITQG